MKAVSKVPVVAAISLMAVVFSLLAGSLVHAQQQSKAQDQKKAQEPKKKEAEDTGQVLKLGTKLVNVLFSVTDKQNRYIDDLKIEDVQILENGQAQQIAFFKREFDLPLTLAIMVDVSGSEQYTLPRLKDAGSRFIESIIKSGKDTAAIIKFEGEATLMQSLTSNKARLLKGLEDVAFIPPPPVGVFGGATPGINGNSRQGGTSIYDSVIATCSDLLAKEAGRKTIVLLTDGVDTTSRLKLDDAVNEALKAEVVIYAIGIGDPGGPGSFGGNGVDEGKLRKMTEATGGRLFVPNHRGDLSSAFIQLEQDMRQQYLLAYEPNNEALDGSFRKLEIKVPKLKDNKDIKIRHRKGYYAQKG